MSILEATTRREFLRRGLGLIGFGASVPAFLAQTMRAMALEVDGSRVASRSGVPDERVLVVVHFAGGNDGLNTIVPYRNDDYFRLRPRLSLAADKVIKIDDSFGFHPEAAGFKELWDAGRLSVLHGVGYPNPNRSHFVSSRIWHTGSPSGEQKEGWIGRYFDHCCNGADPPPLSGIAIEEEVPLAMRGERFLPICAKKPETFGAERPRQNLERHIEENLEAVPAPPKKGESTLEFLRRSAMDATVSAERLRAAAKKPIDGAEFPKSEFGRELESVARMIASGLPTKIYYVSLSGFDTHAGQLDRHARVLREGSAGLAAFVDALQKSGDLGRTLVMVFSEFGRRAGENSSGGTDHGQAGPMLLVGDVVKPGFQGTIPPLDRLQLGDQVFNQDFRQVYATILRDWLKTPPEKLLGGQWKSLPVLKA